MTHATAWRGGGVAIGGGVPDSYHWEFSAAGQGRFRPYAGRPYQLITMWVDVKSASDGVTLDLGTTPGGSQVVSGIDLGTTADGQYRYFNPVRVELDADGYLYATPSAPVPGGSFIVRYTVITNYPACEGLRLGTRGSVILSNSLFVANGASDGAYLDQLAVDNKNWQIRNSHFETYDPVNQSAINTKSPLTGAPISGCTFTGPVTNIGGFAD